MSESARDEYDRLTDEAYEMSLAEGADPDDPAYVELHRRIDELAKELGIVNDPGDADDDLPMPPVPVPPPVANDETVDALAAEFGLDDEGKEELRAHLRP